MTLRCQCGRTYKFDLNQGKPKHMHVGESGAALFTRYWAKDHAGVSSPPCPACKKEGKG